MGGPFFEEPAPRWARTLYWRVFYLAASKRAFFNLIEEALRIRAGINAAPSFTRKGDGFCGRRFTRALFFRSNIFFIPALFFRGVRRYGQLFSVGAFAAIVIGYQRRMFGTSSII
jgi:hypothetical protein